MPKHLTARLSFSLLLALGCGTEAEKSNVQGAAPHGGIHFRFLASDKKEAVEIGAEPADPSTPGVSKLNSHQIFAYFTKFDGLTPLPSPPTDVKILRGSLPPILLSPKDAPGRVGRYLSTPGPYGEELRGVLEAMIDGQKVDVPFIKR